MKLTRIKLSVSVSTDDPEACLSTLADYVENVLTKHEGLPTHSYIPDDRTVVIETDKQGASMLLEQLLEEYASLGTEDNDLDIYCINVFCDDPELQSMFINERLNIQAVSQEVFCEQLSEHFASMESLLNVSKRLALMDASLQLNGVYKFKDMMQILCTTLSANVVEEINECFEEQVH